MADLSGQVGRDPPGQRRPRYTEDFPLPWKTVRLHYGIATRAAKGSFRYRRVRVLCWWECADGVAQFSMEMAQFDLISITFACALPRPHTSACCAVHGRCGSPCEPIPLAQLASLCEAMLRQRHTLTTVFRSIQRFGYDEGGARAAHVLSRWASSVGGCGTRNRGSGGSVACSRHDAAPFHLCLRSGGGGMVSPAD